MNTGETRNNFLTLLLPSRMTIHIKQAIGSETAIEKQASWACRKRDGVCVDVMGRHRARLKF